MSSGDRTPYEILAVQLGMAGQAINGNANIEHADLFRLSEEHGRTGGLEAEANRLRAELVRVLADLRFRDHQLLFVRRENDRLHEVERKWVAAERDLDAIAKANAGAGGPWPQSILDRQTAEARAALSAEER
jgi:hypothetical protein